MFFHFSCSYLHADDHVYMKYNASQPFTVKIHVTRTNNRCANLNLSQVGNSVAVTSKLPGHEQPDSGLFIIDMHSITFIPSTSRLASKSPVKSSPNPSKMTWSKSQHENKKK
jgi:hypothetical protein